MKKKLYFFLLAAFLATASQFAFADITTGLRIHYDFDQIDSTTDAVKIPYFADKSGNNLNGIIEGAIPLVNSYKATGKAINLNDTDKVVRAPENMFEGVSDFTISLWINQNQNVKWARYFDFGSNKDQYMYLCTDGDIGDFIRFEMDLDVNPSNENDDGMITYVKATKKLTFNKWNHLTITGDYEIGADTTSTIKIYMNGVLCATTTKFKIAPYMLGTMTHPYFGDSQWPDPTPNSMVDDFYLFTRALSEADVDELAGITAAHKTAYNTLDIDEDLRTEMEEGETLNLPATFGGFDVHWTTTDATVIGIDGIPKHSMVAITDATLTAAISPTGVLYPMMEKDFFVSVYPLGPPIANIATFNFPTENISKRNDSIFVANEGEIPFEAFTVGGAQVLTIGDETGDEGVDFFNVYVSDNRATGSANKQWLDLGKKVGEYVYSLRDHSITLYYRRDSTIDHATWSAQGQLLWAFGNSSNMSGWGSSAWGAMYFEPDQCNVSIVEGNSERSAFDNSTGEFNALKWGTGKTPIGSSWHNITYSQLAGTGYLLVDGIQVATGAMPAPKVQLRKNSNVATFTGTPFNRLGGTLVNDRVSAKNTMLYGFQLLTFGMAGSECNDYFGITDKIADLNTAILNTTYNIPAFMTMLPAMSEARKTLAIGYMKPIHDQVKALYDLCVIDSAAKTPNPETIKALTDSCAKYKIYSADWVKMGTVLKSFDDERALAYPGLDALEADIAAAKEAYDAFEIETELFAFLDAAVITYLKSQIATSSQPANYTFYIKNAGFEEGKGGTKTGSQTNGAFDIPKGWKLDITGNNSKWIGNKFQTENPSEGNSDYEVWSDNQNNLKVWDLSQEMVEALPAGWYVLSADIRAPGGTRGGQHLYAFSLVDSVKIKSDTLEADVAGTGWKGGYSWSQIAYKKVFVMFKSDGERFKVGLHSDSALFKMDNIKLAYFGTSNEEPVLGDKTSLIMNAGFELGGRTTEREGFDATSNISADAGDVFAPKDWTVLANANATANNAIINVIAGDGEGANIYRLRADTLTSVKLSQTITSPTVGMFKLNAFVRADSACRSDARLFAKVGRRQEEGMKLMTAVDTLDTFTGWKKLEYTFRAAYMDVIDLGLMTSGNVDVDNFLLENYSNVYVGIKGLPTENNGTFKTYAKDGIIYISGVTSKDRVSVYDIAGRQISVKNPSQIKVSKGMYMIKINNEVIKQLVK